MKKIVKKHDFSVFRPFGQSARRVVGQSFIFRLLTLTLDSSREQSKNFKKKLSLLTSGEALLMESQ